ncbi:Sjogren's syndrome/scleroderma autoantigen 1 family protein [Halobacterium hubeiense]|uniref:Sjogren's syndrome/scleroderma autoantigen 1 family protein n=1 Tax=Halobacterium hubeiense TaxID=1407499 RepID=UPI003C740530
MSDTDDGFDEEAVREELREKYADDDRGGTERMSELLLQGATMTNQHCDRCGNPIFRYEGQSFCPNCQQAAAQQQGAEQGAAGQADAQTQADQQPGAAGDAEQPEPARGRQPNGDAAAPQQPANGEQPTDRQQPAESGQPARSPREQPNGTPQPAGGGSPAAASGEAADALESSIAALARRGASADDPRRAREFLEAAREAAEALDALHRNA